MPVLTPSDLQHLQHCLALAERGQWRVFPNPMVGAVLVNGREVIGEGFHQRVGGPHAEIEAIRDAQRRGRRDLLEGSTLYVNLEPCAHEGRTAPCAVAVREAGIKRVVCAHLDPNPRARGGAEALRKAGVIVELVAAGAGPEGALLRQAVALNTRFLLPIVQQRAQVTLKWAMSLDGKIATHTGESQWISGPQGRDWSLGLRYINDAILVGSETALEDDPRLTRRGGTQEEAAEPILRVVADRRLRLDSNAAMFREVGPVLIFSEASGLVRDDGNERYERLREVGAEVVLLDKVTPKAMVAELGSRGVGSVLVEGGGEVLGAFRDDGMLDRVAVCCAPKVIGGATARGPVLGAGAKSLQDAFLLGWSKGQQVGSDWVIEGVEQKCLQDLLSSVVE